MNALGLLFPAPVSGAVNNLASKQAAPARSSPARGQANPNNSEVHMKTVAAILTLALSISGCAGAIEATQYGESDAGATTTETPDAGESTTDAGESATIEPEQPVYQLGDLCYCCAWNPDGAGYPNGEVVCVKGEITILEGLMCLAIADASAPSWVPRRHGCLLDNPWGAP